jgi:hypothetical protein
MATTTPNFGWPVPTSTDLVKDGATAIEALGDSIDASLLDLKGGTTGQVLSKNSNTDMDFVWVTDAGGDITGVTAGTGISGGGTSGTVTVTNSMATAIDAKGDLIAGTGADAFARLAVGTNGQVLTADSAETTGMKWATSSAAKSYSLLNAGGTALTGSGTITISGISGIDNLRVFILDGSSSSASAEVQILLNSDTASNYNIFTGYQSASLTSFTGGTGQTALSVGYLSNNATSRLMLSAEIAGANTSGVKMATFSSGASLGGGTDNALIAGGGYWNNSATVSSISVKVTTGNWDQGTVYVYGAA